MGGATSVDRATLEALPKPRPPRSGIQTWLGKPFEIGGISMGKSSISMVDFPAMLDDIGG